MDVYKTDVANFMGGIFSQSPFKEYVSYFNAIAINVPSNESGVKHPRTTADSDCTSVPVLNADNYFGSSFDTNGIHRLLAPGSYVKVFNVLSASFPLYDQAFIVVNTPYYGGSGGSFATASTNSSANEVAVHEIGHSFSFLADEYWAGISFAAEKPNMTQESDPSKVKWKSWVGTDAVGVFAFSENAAWHRPHQNCKMRALNNPFCDVCREAFIERIHDLVHPVDSYLPAESTIALTKDPLTFSIKTIHPIPNTLKTTWSKNGAAFTHNKEEITIPFLDFSEGDNTVKVELTDTTLLSRSPTHSVKHVSVVTWKITNNVITGLSIDPSETQYKLSVYPNPSAEKITLSYSLSKEGNVKMTITDIAGHKLKTLVDEKQSAGEYTYHASGSDLNISVGGVYILNLLIDGTRITEKIVRE